MLTRPSLLRRLAVVVALGLLASGCSLNMLGAPTGHLTLTARFDDISDLGPGHTVQVANVVVGSVTKVVLDGYRAKVTMSITDGHPIPVGSSATVRRTSLLGEPFIELAFPDGGPEARGTPLANGAEITATSTDPSVEELAGRAGQLVAAINPDDLATSVQATAEALGGRGAELHRLVAQLNTLIGGIDAQKGDLAATIDNLGTLGAKVSPVAGQLGSLLDSTAKTTKVLGADTQRLVTALGNFNDVATTVNKTILIPHADELAALLRNASTVVGSLSNDQGVLAHMADSFALFVPRITRAISKDQLLVFTWIDVTLALGGKAVSSLIPPSIAFLAGP